MWSWPYTDKNQSQYYCYTTVTLRVGIIISVGQRTILHAYTHAPIYILYHREREDTTPTIHHYRSPVW